MIRDEPPHEPRRNDSAVLPVDEHATIAPPEGRSYISLVRDITERTGEEKAPRGSEACFRSLVHNVPDMLTIYEANGTIRYQNPAAERVLGYRPEELEGTHIIHLIHPEDRPRLQALRATVLRQPGSHPATEIRVCHRDGSYRDLEVVETNLFDDPSVEGIVASSRDITERKCLERQLAHRAFHDALTGLPNRTLFMDRLGHALVGAERWQRGLAVLFLDLDRFKLVNDALGHGAGDALLVAVADRLRGCLRESETLARFGGDEFTVLVEDIEQLSDAIRIATRICDALQDAFVLTGREFVVTARIGIALSDGAQRLPDDLLREADLALYQAKATGGARYAVFGAVVSDLSQLCD